MKKGISETIKIELTDKEIYAIEAALEMWEDVQRDTEPDEDDCDAMAEYYQDLSGIKMAIQTIARAKRSL